MEKLYLLTGPLYYLIQYPSKNIACGHHILPLPSPVFKEKRKAEAEEKRVMANGLPFPAVVSGLYLDKRLYSTSFYISMNVTLTRRSVSVQSHSSTL